MHAVINFISGCCKEVQSDNRAKEINILLIDREREKFEGRNYC